VAPQLISYREALARQNEHLDRITSRLYTSIQELGSPVPQRPVMVGMGASFAALCAPVAFLRAHKVAALRVVASDFSSVSYAFSDLVLGLSQSGQSKETVEAVALAGRRSMAIVNIVESPLARVAARIVDIGGVADSLASTIGYTGSLVTMGMLAETWATGQPGPAWRNIAERVAAFEAEIEPLVSELAEEWAQFALVDIVGSGAYWGAADAAALLLREVSRLPTAAFESRQYLHGPMEATNAVGHVVIGAADLELISGLLARGGHAVLKISHEDADDRNGSTRIVRIPRSSVVEETIFIGVLFQHLADRLAASRSVDPDEFLFLSNDTKLDK
jgi:glutamine---fructose-6-phosphate transaminase (isomerizing)